MYVDDLKLLAKKKEKKRNEMEVLIETVWKSTEHIGMKLSIENA